MKDGIEKGIGFLLAEYSVMVVLLGLENEVR